MSARIPEPGLWGVVEATVLDDEGSLPWFRHDGHLWMDAHGRVARWDDLIDPTLIRPGIEERTA